jgi:outer membrane protein assembly factor BamB
MASSPVLVRDRLIVPMDNSGESFIAAVETKYGKNVWKVERPREINWVTPLVREIKGKTEILFAGATGLTAYDAATGDKRWNYKGAPGSIPTGSLDGNALYLPVGGVSKVKLGEEGVIGEPEWKTAPLQPGMASPLVYGGRVYATNGQGFISCADAKSGKLLYKERVKGAFSASPLGGDGKVYCLNETGVCTVLKSDSEATPTRSSQATNWERRRLALPPSPTGSSSSAPTRRCTRSGNKY